MKLKIKEFYFNIILFIYKIPRISRDVQSRRTSLCKTRTCDTIFVLPRVLFLYLQTIMQCSIVCVFMCVLMRHVLFLLCLHTCTHAYRHTYAEFLVCRNVHLYVASFYLFHRYALVSGRGHAHVYVCVCLYVSIPYNEGSVKYDKSGHPKNPKNFN